MVFFFFFSFSFHIGLLLLLFFFSLSCWVWFGLLYIYIFFFPFFSFLLLLVFVWVSVLNQSEFQCWIGVSFGVESVEFGVDSVWVLVLNRSEFGVESVWIFVLNWWVACRFGCGFFLGFGEWWWWWAVEGFFFGICCLWWMVMVSFFLGWWVQWWWVAVSIWVLYFFFFWVWVCGYWCLMDRLNWKVWPIYRYESHKKIEKLSDEKLSKVCRTGGYRKLGYFKWWVMSDKWRKLSEKWWRKKKKKPNSPLISGHWPLHFKKCFFLKKKKLSYLSSCMTTPYGECLL